MDNMTVLKNICFEYTDDIVCDGNEIHALVNKKYASDLQSKLEKKGCTLLSISKKSQNPSEIYEPQNPRETHDSLRFAEIHRY